MSKVIVLIAIAAFFTGCATTKEAPKPLPKQPAPSAPKPKPAAKKREQVQMDRSTASKKLAKAVDLVEAGDAAGAIKTLTSIVNAKGVPGVTDEALFRLALLTLKPSPEAPASRRGRHLLRRLKEEYPSSSWAAHGSSLLDLIGIDDDLRAQNRTLRANNQSLTRKINELNENIEQLKHLDLELEQKNR